MRTRILVQPPESSRLKAARITLSTGEEIGEHTTKDREEIIIVLTGSILLLNGGQEIKLSESDAYFIAEGIPHNVRNVSGQEAEYMYVAAFK